MYSRQSIRRELEVLLPAEIQARIRALAFNAMLPSPRARKKPPSFIGWTSAGHDITEIRNHLKGCTDVRVWGEGDFRLWGYLSGGRLAVVCLNTGRVSYFDQKPDWYPAPECTQFTLDRPVKELWRLSALKIYLLVHIGKEDRWLRTYRRSPSA